MKTVSFFSLMFMVISTVFAQTAMTSVVLTPLLTPEHVYWLLIYAILGSLGVIGLLLGLDKLIAVFFKRNDGENAVKKYSSEGIARILPLVIEGITVILVILTVIILGVSRIISAEGTLGILGSIVGYVLGKSGRKDLTSTNGSAV